MQRLINIAFLLVVSGCFAFLYPLRTYLDYRLSVLAGKEPPTIFPARQFRILLIMFALIWLAHVLAFATSAIVCQHIIAFLGQGWAWIMDRVRELFNLNTLLIALGVALVYLVFKILQNPNLFLKNPLRALVEISTATFKELGGPLKTIGTLLIVLVFISALSAIFSIVNRLAGRVISIDIATFINQWVLSIGIIGITVILYLWCSLRLIKKDLKDRRCWSDIHNTLVKDGVMYGLIFLFVSCALYHWSAFLQTYSFKAQIPFLLTLANIHILGYIGSVYLDYKNIRLYRQGNFRRDLYPYDWQIEAAKRHIAMKDFWFLTPMVLVSWIYFFGRVMSLAKAGLTP
jgi:hypothetical protein